MEPISVETISEDIFQCGRCKVAFTSLTMFFSHKREPCVPPVWSAVLGNNLAATVPAISSDNIENQPSELFNNRVQIAQCEENYTYLNTSMPQNSTEALNSEQFIDQTQQQKPVQTSCPKCSKNFNKKSNMCVHQRTHGVKPYQCPVCGRCFTQNTHLQRHLHGHRVWPDGLSNTVPASATITPKDYACSYCSLILPDYTKFRIHLKIHVSHKMFKCIQGECSQLFEDLDLLLSHVAESHCVQVYYCYLCDETCHSLEKIALHQQNHPQQKTKTKKKFSCIHCDASYGTLAKLTFHAATHVHVKKCLKCNKTFSSEKRLRYHLRIHEEARPFQCGVCGASFQLKKYLTTHELKHGERIFSCSHCHMTFKRKDLMNRHSLIHQPRKQFECPFKDLLGCGLLFTRKDKLKLHLKSHAKKLVAKDKPKQNKNKKV